MQVIKQVTETVANLHGGALVQLGNGHHRFEIVGAVIDAAFYAPWNAIF